MVVGPKNLRLLANQPGRVMGIARASHAGPNIMAGHARQEVLVPDDLDALHVGKDLAKLSRISTAHALTRSFSPRVDRVFICGGHRLARG